MTELKQRIIDLAERSVRISREGLAGEPAAFGNPAFSRFMGPTAVLALEGDAEARKRYVETLVAAASDRRGIDSHIVNGRLSDCFCMRSTVESYDALIAAELIPADVQSKLAAWLYEFALVTFDGRVQQLPNFRGWHLRNQNVPATALYLIADLLDRRHPGQFDTASIWAWADAQIVGWNLTWRGPDDSWLYQFIWTWSAYLHARLRQPELLHCENARRCCEFYKVLSLPGRGGDLIIGESKPGDLLGAAVSLLLGATLFDDGEQLFLASRQIDEMWGRGIDEALVDRGPEFFRLYSLCPDALEPVPLAGRASCLIESPLAGRGWTLPLPYCDEVKTTDPRYPLLGEDLSNWDAMYQVQDPEAYAEQKPDKIVFACSDEPGAMYAVADLRAHGLHDHADALGISVLLCDGLPWLVENSYFPRGIAGQRWYHNVALAVPGEVDAGTLRSWRADTWRSVESGDAAFDDHRDFVAARAVLRHDGFDYVAFDEQHFDYERLYLFVPDVLMLVVDRLHAQRAGTATVGQIWHSPADLDLTGQALTLGHGRRRFYAAFAQTTAMQSEQSQHEVEQFDAFYFQRNRPVNDLLWYATRDFAAAETVCLAAAFAREPLSLSVADDHRLTTVTVRGITVTISADGNMKVTF